MGFDNLPIDGSNKGIPVARREQYFDASDTPKISPINLTTAWQELVPPDGAAECEIWSDTEAAAFRVASDDGGDEGYGTGVIGRKELVSCGKQNSIWVYGEAVISLSFKFRMVKD